MRDLPPLARVPLLVLGFIALAAGILGGLARLGADASAPASAVAWHGALMASAFFGTLIALERAVAIGQGWAYAAPAVQGVGGVALLTGAGEVAFALLAAGAGIFVVASLVIYRRQRALHTGVLAAGALCLLGADLWLALHQAIERAVPLWVAFFVLTIGGERLELSRLVPVPPWARHLFAVLSLAIAAAATLGNDTALGLLLLAVAVWLVRYDLATRTVRGPGITRYIAICLLAGYAWLALGALALAAGLARDAALHAILLGFVFSMVFGHAPVIFPAVLRIALPYRPWFYAPLALLHASVLARMLAVLGGDAALQRVAGIGNAASIGFFILAAVASAAMARK